MPILYKRTAPVFQRAQFVVHDNERRALIIVGGGMSNSVLHPVRPERVEGSKGFCEQLPP
ncbi:hypothetical protein EBZ39_12060 [bacterium]|nr:hypothetical protein [bacterium]